MQIPSRRRILAGLWTFPVAGVVAVTALLLKGFTSLPVGDLAAWAASVTSDRYMAAQYLYILAYAIPFFGFWSLYMLLAQNQKERLAFWGLMGTLLGTALPLTTLGVLSYASPVFGSLYRQGSTQLPQLLNEIAMGPSMVLGLPGALLYVGGCLAFGIAVWQSGAFHKWAGVGLVLHGVFVAFGFGMPILLVFSWVLLAACGLVFVVGARKGA